MRLSTEQRSTQLPDIPVLPERLEDSEEYRDVLAMTQRLFPGPIEIHREQDPELPEEYVVFDVHPRGSFEEVMARDREWHRECGMLAGSGCFLYGLALWLDDEPE